MKTKPILAVLSLALGAGIALPAGAQEALVIRNSRSKAVYSPLFS